MAVAGDSSRVAQMAGIRLPIETHLLQAFVTEPIKPMLHHILGFGAVYFYISQSDHGGLVFGGDLDGYNSYARRGNLTSVMQTVSAAKSLLPCISRIKILRHWGGAVDMSMDGSPIIDKTHKERLYFNGGWCYGGFKATSRFRIFASRICWRMIHRIRWRRNFSCQDSATEKQLTKKAADRLRRRIKRCCESYAPFADCATTPNFPTAAMHPPPPPFADGDINRWHDYIYLRENPKGRHREFWRHSHGCRQWLVVERDTATHEIFSVSSADEKSNE